MAARRRRPSERCTSSALDKTGAPVADLGPADFVVREDKVAREVLSVAPAAEPMQIALLVDNSQAAEPFIRDYREALPAFVDALTTASGRRRGTRSPSSPLAERPTITTDYTTDRGALVKGVQRIFSMHGQRHLSARRHHRNQPGDHQAPLAAAGDRRHHDRRARVERPLLPAGARAAAGVGRGAPRHRRRQADERVARSLGGDLRRARAARAGRYDNILTGNALTGRLKQVAAELTHQFRVTYARPQSLIPPEQVTVSAAKPGLTVRGTPVVADREQERP